MVIKHFRREVITVRSSVGLQRATIYEQRCCSPTGRLVSRVYGRNSIMSAVGQHGSFNAGIVHLHHEGSRDARAFFYPQRGLCGSILQSDTHLSTFMIKTTIVKHTHSHAHTHTLLGMSYPTDWTVPDMVPCASTTKASVVCRKTRNNFHVIAWKKKKSFEDRMKERNIKRWNTHLMESYRDWLTRTLSLSSSDASTNARLVIYV